MADDTIRTTLSDLLSRWMGATDPREATALTPQESAQMGVTDYATPITTLLADETGRRYFVVGVSQIGSTEEVVGP